YALPEEKIAMHPLEKRDVSKLLIYKNGEIAEDKFFNIEKYLPADGLIIFNDTKVINARLLFTKTTGAAIEVFCLEPAGDIKEYQTVLSATGAIAYKCFVGGAAKWKNEILEKKIVVQNRAAILYAKLKDRKADYFIVEFSWSPASYSFAEILEASGLVPLPPYIHRTADLEDKSRYQTIYAAYDGSVAAPTAGLHFTKNVLSSLHKNNIEQAFVTLHVGAGTFKPVKAETMEGHDMHAEYIDVDVATIEKIIQHLGNITAVGTTSIRTIESIFWIGIKIIEKPGIENLTLSQWEIYEPGMPETTTSANESLSVLLKWMKEKNLQRLFTKTQLMIAPGYKFRIVQRLITNFHQPQSTLLLLVAAAIGNNQTTGQAGWKKMYSYALENDFRFLSYGDSNLIFMAE
ncbi:MAG: S-adenosylmethionine:tRNA ribosyltransferase-isomerase, partial [Ferruginibacter sp.]